MMNTMFDVLIMMNMMLIMMNMMFDEDSDNICDENDDNINDDVYNT